jgi:hypothetical protein
MALSGSPSGQLPGNETRIYGQTGGATINDCADGWTMRFAPGGYPK